MPTGWTRLHALSVPRQSPQRAHLRAFAPVALPGKLSLQMAHCVQVATYGPSSERPSPAFALPFPSVICPPSTRLRLGLHHVCPHPPPRSQEHELQGYQGGHAPATLPEILSCPRRPQHHHLHMRGWYVPPGVSGAPGQTDSLVRAMFTGVGGLQTEWSPGLWERKVTPPAPRHGPNQAGAAGRGPSSFAGPWGPRGGEAPLLWEKEGTAKAPLQAPPRSLPRRVTCTLGSERPGWGPPCVLAHPSRDTSWTPLRRMKNSCEAGVPAAEATRARSWEASHPGPDFRGKSMPEKMGRECLAAFGLRG